MWHRLGWSVNEYFLYANHPLFYTFIIIIVSVTIHFLISPLFPVNNSYLNLWSLPFVSLTLSLEGLVRGEQLGGASLPAGLKPWHKPKCKALRGSGQSLVPIQARQRLDWQEPRGEALEDVGWQKTQYVSSQKENYILGCVKSSVARRWREVINPFTLMRPHLEHLASAQGHRSARMSSEKDYKNH